MSELQQYKNAYATLLGQVDTIITSLEAVREIYSPDPEAMARHAMQEAMILALTKAIRDAEENFMREDPER